MGNLPPPPHNSPGPPVLLTGVPLRGQLSRASWPGAQPDDIEFTDGSLSVPVSLRLNPSPPCRLELILTRWALVPVKPCSPALPAALALEVDEAQESNGPALFGSQEPDAHAPPGVLVGVVERIVPSPAILVLSDGSRVALGSRHGFTPGLREGALVSLRGARSCGLAGSFPALFLGSPSGIAVLRHSPLATPAPTWADHLDEASLASTLPTALFHLAVRPLRPAGPCPLLAWLGEAQGEHAPFTGALLEADLDRVRWSAERSSVTALTTMWHRGGGRDAILLRARPPLHRDPSVPPYLEITLCPALGVMPGDTSRRALLLTSAGLNEPAALFLGRYALLKTSAVAGFPPTLVVWANDDLRRLDETSGVWAALPNPSPCVTLARPLPPLRTLLGARLVPPSLAPSGLVIHVGGSPGERNASVRLMDPASGDFADCYVPAPLVPFLHIGAEVALIGMERHLNASNRTYFKSQAPRLALLALSPHLLWSARPSAPYKTLARRPPAEGKANLAWKTWARVDRITRVDLTLAPPRRGRLNVSVSALIDDGSGLADCWADQGAGLSLLGIAPGSEPEGVLRELARRFGRVVLKEAAFSQEDGQGGARILGHKQWEVVEVGTLGTPGALSPAVRGKIFAALAQCPRTVEHVWALYLHLPGRARRDIRAVDAEEAEFGFGQGSREGSRQAAVGRTKVEVSSWFAPKVKLLQAWHSSPL